MRDELNPADFQAQCLYNRYIVCTDSSKCARCGWCPDVAEARLARIKAGMKQNRDKMTSILLRSNLSTDEIVTRLRKIWR